ncbi:hypothetical protein ACX1M3_01935 [Mycoplasma sp. Z463D]
MYKTDGSTHQTGVKGEDKILHFLNNPDNFTNLKNIFENYYDLQISQPFNFIQKGGTTYRVDIYDISNKISLSIKSKRKTRNKYHGTFDLLNTSKILSYVELDNFSFLQSLGKYEALLKWLKENRVTNKQVVNEKLNEVIANIFDKLDGNVAYKIFKNVQTREKGIIDVIRDYSKSSLDEIRFEDLHFLKKDWIKLEAMKLVGSHTKSNSKKSARIQYSDETSSPFRLRIALNNGVQALLVQLGLAPKIAGKNYTSILTLKIQVDDISYILDKYEIKK